MTETIQITLNSRLLRRLKQAALQSGKSVESIITELIKQYLNKESEARHIEFEAYIAMHEELTQTYLGQHVAIHGRRVIDHDEDADVLVKRVHTLYGTMPVLFIQVEEKAVPEYVIHGMHVIEPE